MQQLVWARMERDRWIRERDGERERELDLNLTMKESDVPNGFKEYRRCVSLPEKRGRLLAHVRISFLYFSM